MEIEERILKDYDEAWKRLIELFFPEFMEFFFPKYASYIDFNKKIKFLDKELKKLFPKSKEEKGEVDLLIECYLKNGNKLPLYLHIDIQGYYDTSFSQRMFRYLYRIYDRFKKFPISLVVFSDKYKNYHPNKFEWKFEENYLFYKYPYAKLLDYLGREKELTKSKNPFAKIVKAFLAEYKAKGNVNLKFLFRKELIKELKELGYSKERIIELYRVIALFVSLPEKMEEQIFEEFDKELLEGGNKEMIVLPFEKKAYKRGKEEGLKEGLKEGLRKGVLMEKKNLAKKLYKKGYSLETISELLEINVETLKNWLEK